MGVGFHPTIGQHLKKQSTTQMRNLCILLSVLLGLASADKTAGGHVASASGQVPASAPASGLPPYYPEYDYAYEPQSQLFSSSSSSASSLDRQASIEAVLGAPVVITAFAAALFGGILSPLISEGLSRMSDYQIEWPSFDQKVQRRRKTKTKSSNKARELANNVTWLDILEGVNTVVSAIRSKRSVADEHMSTENISF